jgi:crossover junction endodeoxyribonuclease RusA
MKVILELPHPPSVNVYYRRSGHHIHISEQGRKFKLNVSEIIATHHHIKFNMLRLKVHIDYYPPTKRKTDIDNRIKAVLDSLTDAGLWLDDEQVDELSIKRMTVYKGGKIVVTVETLDGKDE